MNRWQYFGLILRCAAFCFVLAAPNEPLVAKELAEGRGDFLFVDPEGNPDRPIKVWYYRPAELRAESLVVFAMHGGNQNGEIIRNIWKKYAEQKGFVLLCPEFSKQHYPDLKEYLLGYMVDSAGNVRDKKKWLFTAIERIFDEVVEANHLQAKHYSIYGHSGGGQFVHRLVLFLPEARYDVAIAANPGWYTMLRDELEYPFGLRGSTANEQQLRKLFSRQFVLLLGTADTGFLGPTDGNSDPENLRQAPEAMAQGPHRLARGKEFWRTSQLRAKQLGIKSRWQLQMVPGVAHSNSKMSPHAAKLIP